MLIGDLPNKFLLFRTRLLFWSSIDDETDRYIFVQLFVDTRGTRLAAADSHIYYSIPYYLDLVLQKF